MMRSKSAFCNAVISRDWKILFLADTVNFWLRHLMKEGLNVKYPRKF